MKKLPWIFRIAAAVIMLQTLYFKFTGHPESIDLFTKLGVEPWGRFGTGIVELIASILLLLQSTVIIGALLTIGIMSGALLSHVTVLGIESKGDGGQLFIMAIIALICSLITAYIYRENISKYFKK